MSLFFDSLSLALIVVITQLCRLLNAHVIPFEATESLKDNGSDRRVSPDLFDSLGELARVVDIAYCIGTTGVQKPFQCLSHCRDLKGFELVDVRVALNSICPVKIN